MEQKLTAEQISDFEDYDIGDGSTPQAARKNRDSRTN
jgi:hypothetical protein